MSEAALPINWASVKLGEVTTILGGGTPSCDVPEYYGGETLWAVPSDVASLDDLWIDETWNTITEDGLKNSPAVLLPAGAVLMTTRAAADPIAIARQSMCTNQDFANFVCDGRILFNEYLAYWLSYVKPRLIRFAGGVAGGGISRPPLSKAEMPLPPIPEQRRIAEILREAYELRRLHRKADEKAQQLLRALFDEMFGSKPHLHDIQKRLLSNFAETGYGTTESMSNDPADAIPILRTSNLSEGRLDYSNLKHVKLADKEREKLSLKNGDVLLARSTDNQELVGRSVPYEDDGITRTFASYLIRVRLDADVMLPEYLSDYLASAEGRYHLTKKAQTSAGHYNITSRALANLIVPAPGIEEQKRYASLRKEILKLGSEIESSTAKFDSLFRSLLAQAFGGELTAEWREKHAEELLEAAAERNATLGATEKSIALSKGGGSMLDERNVALDATEKQQVDEAQTSRASSVTNFLIRAAGRSLEVLFDVLAGKPYPEIAKPMFNYMVDHLGELTFRPEEEEQPLTLLPHRRDEADRRSHSLRELSEEQDKVYLATQFVSGCFVPEMLAQKSGMDITTVQRGLQALAAMGLVQAISLKLDHPDLPPLSIAPAYRARRIESEMITPEEEGL